jgi:hypothetical protein
LSPGARQSVSKGSVSQPPVPLRGRDHNAVRAAELLRARYDREDVRDHGRVAAKRSSVPTHPTTARVGVQPLRSADLERA